MKGRKIERDRESQESSPPNDVYYGTHENETLGKSPPTLGILRKEVKERVIKLVWTTPHTQKLFLFVGKDHYITYLNHY